MEGKTECHWKSGQWQNEQAGQAVQLAPLCQVVHFGSAAKSDLCSVASELSALIWSRAARHDGITGARHLADSYTHA